MEAAKKIAKKLIMLRGDKSRLEVSKALGLTKSAIAMYERGARVPRDDIKVKIAKFYGKSVEEIFFAQ